MLARTSPIGLVARRAAAMIMAAVLTTRCVPIANTTQLAPRATRDSLVLMIGSATGAGAATSVYGLSVIRCGDERAFWTIAADGSRSLPERIAYGRLIPGFETRAGPEPLLPGCYQAIVSGADPVTFDVTATGQIRVRGP